MSDPEFGSSRDELSSQKELIERACAQFKTASRAGRRPEIEEFVEQFPNLDRRVLVEKLITLEVELQGTRDETLTFDARQQPPSLDGYYQRFPEATPILDALRQKWMQSPSTSPEMELPHTVELPPHLVAVQPAAHAPGRRIQQFELQAFLGQGGFGVVWRAHDQNLQRDVALKFPRPDRLNDSNRAQFLEEARSAAKLRHPNIVAIYEVGEHDGEIYIVSELVDGITLKSWSQAHALSPTAAARTIAKLATAVQHAHEQGIVHRDLKPANVLVDKQGEPHIADFGMAKRDHVDATPAHLPGQLLGTPAYMAPEQARGDHDAIDARTDVYALGAILYELLTADRPFHGDTALLLEQVQHTVPKAPRLIKPDIPQELEAICLRCLAKESAERYPTAQALADDIHLFLAGEAIPGIPVAMPRRVRKWCYRHRRFVMAIALTFCVAMTVAGSVAWQFRGTRPIPIDVREVQFITEPAGSEITAVAIDPKTGEPDSTRIHNAQGRTPLVMQLPPGDYLIVAALDETRFNEVYRHVPPYDETVPFGHNHQRWNKGPSGVINVATIPIPPADMISGMAPIAATERLVEPLRRNEKTSRVWRVPAFYVDRRETTIQDLRESAIRKYGAKDWEMLLKTHPTADPGPGPVPKVSGMSWIAKLEALGKRLPSAPEMYYLAHVVCPQPPAQAPNVAATDECTLPERGTIEGLHSGLLEWTSTKIGGPFTGYTANNDLNDAWGLLRATGGAAAVAGKSSSTGFQSTYLPHENVATIRGVRSVRPRRRPEDFVREVPLKSE